MKTTLFAAAATLSLVTAAAAHAQEGLGEPFPFRAPGLTVVSPLAYAADTGSAAHPDLTGRPCELVSAGNGPNAATLIITSEGTVQTVNSLPRGSVAGTIAYTQTQSVRRH